ncbi:MAG: sulfotransferase domain-containing protein [Chthoniobacterales bacterium]
MYGLSRSKTAMPWRLNLSSRSAELSGADAFVISIPKSGRTWVRAFLSSYYCNRYEVPFCLDPSKELDARIPKIIYSHDLFEHRSKGRWWDRIRGKFLIPAPELRRAKIVFLVRDPRDAFVSHYVQLTRPSADAPDSIKKLSASEMLRDPLLGIGQIVDTMNDWLEDFRDRPNATLIRYEDLKADPIAHFAEVLRGIGEADISETALRSAVEFSQFGNMKKLEAAGAFDSKILQTRDQQDPESYNVRRGKIGGYRDYLSPDDQAYAAGLVRTLAGDFGYQ